jgi:hypothetical protein
LVLGHRRASIVESEIEVETLVAEGVVGAFNFRGLVSDFDYTEVISGLKEGDEVALLATIALQASRDRSSARARSMVGGALPGGSNTTNRPAAGGRPTGGGGPR